MCDTFVAVTEATADGSVILGKNSDREPNEAQPIVHLPAADHEPNAPVEGRLRVRGAGTAYACGSSE